MELYEKNGNILYILNVLKKYSDEEHKLSILELKDKIKEEYGEDIDPRTIIEPRMAKGIIKKCKNLQNV